ncbi:MAG TPA: hypothetical protein PKA87_06540, partial [Microthrixaceae bacterium]|nr:hypothetical protein [Microthrixaceae bacterium]HNA35879.1 hypothetical protein [Microthrixaceae bacterium]
MTPIVGAVGVQSEVTPSGSAGVRVATANIRHGRPEGAAGPDPARMADTLGRIGADVLAVQEVDRRTRRAG